MARRHRQDRGSKEIVAAWRSLGATVLRIDPAMDRHQRGAPDCLVGYRGRNILVELKAPGEKPRMDQILWHRKWRGQKVRVASSVPEALAAIGVEPEIVAKIERATAWEDAWKQSHEIK